jgi:hypothetical protein
MLADWLLEIAAVLLPGKVWAWLLIAALYVLVIGGLIYFFFIR